MLNVDIAEVVDDGSGGYKPWEDITGAMPGMTYSAIPRVKNDGSVTAEEVRMCISESATNASHEPVALSSKVFEIDINKHWVLDDENCYKYDAVVEVGSMTEPIFSEVTLSSAIGDGYENDTFNLHLDAYAVAGQTPTQPDTGTLTVFGGLTVSETAFYGLGIAAVLILVIHFALALYRKR